MTAQAIPQDLSTRMALNLSRWITRGAIAGGGTVCRQAGVTWAFTPWAGGGGTILYPRFGAKDVPRLDDILDYFSQLRPARGVRCWLIDATPSAALPDVLASHGFKLESRPKWMWLDLKTSPENLETPGKLDVRPVTQDVWERHPHPYHLHPDWREVARRMHVAAARHPTRVRHFAAWIDGRPAGHSTLNLTTGRFGAAGIYDVGVLPEFRNQGIGKAITAATCRIARDLGCPCTVLISTDMGEPVYRKLGFHSLDSHQTWFRPLTSDL